MTFSTSKFFAAMMDSEMFLCFKIIQTDVYSPVVGAVILLLLFFKFEEP